MHGEWSNWQSYSTCSKSCGKGRQTKTRTFTNPAPAHGGNGCRGSSSYTKDCNLTKCPGMLLTFVILIMGA